MKTKMRECLRMSPADNDLDDDMTLIQYQTEARREALVRKGSIIISTSPKKGRVEPIGSSS